MNNYESKYVLHEDGKEDVIIDGYPAYLSYYCKHIQPAGKATKWLYHKREKKVVYNHLQIVRCY